MSKPLFRVVAIALIGLVLVAGVFFTAQAASANAGRLSGRPDATAQDPFYAAQQRGGIHSLAPSQMENDKDGHGCESEKTDPNDF
ncbi:MAG: hypothetical protein HXY42_13145 [Chloroflexi bacterium]|nr:hypothetical protein [Chloroflexota bacterium]